MSWFFTESCVRFGEGVWNVNPPMTCRPEIKSPGNPLALPEDHRSLTVPGIYRLDAIPAGRSMNSLSSAKWRRGPGRGGAWSFANPSLRLSPRFAGRERRGLKSWIEIGVSVDARRAMRPWAAPPPSSLRLCRRSLTGFAKIKKSLQLDAVAGHLLK